MKKVFEKLARALLCGAFCLSGVDAFAAPTISGVKVTSVEPLGVAIDYTVSGATEEDAGLPLCVTLSVGDDSIGALNLAGATSCVNGAHRVYWNMAAEGIVFAPTNASVTVAYLPNPKYCIVNLAGGSATNSYPVAYMDAEPMSGFNMTEYKTTKLVLKRIDAGSFEMQGSSTVKLTKSFYMGLFEVTQNQWELVAGTNPCASTKYGKGDDYPVHFVSYNDIRGSSKGANWPATNAVDEASFLGKLRERTKLVFDLPTEAQWEYTCRAGTTTTYSYGDKENGDYMWYVDNSEKTHEVGTKNANPWGFYDMHGNVQEWCLDWSGTLSYGTDPKGLSSGSDRVRRGGGWGNKAAYCTSSYRGINNPSDSNNGLGFRLSRTLPADADAASVPVKFALGRICADGGSVDGKMSLGYAPTKTRNAVVAVNDEVLLNADVAGSWTWTAQTAGVYAVSHAVGDEVMSASFVVTNGYAKVEETPNVPMDVVAGITLSPSGEVAVAAKGATSDVKQSIKISGESGEAWTGATSADWLKLNDTSGTATGKSVICTILENVDAEGRVGYVYIAGQTLTVMQAGRGATVDAQVTADGAGGEVAVAIAVTDETTTWSASSECPWIQVVTASGTGSGEVKLQVLPWNKTTSRTGTVTVAGQTVTVTQSAATLEVSATSAAVVAQGKTVGVDVETAKAVEWAIADVPEWIALEGDVARRGTDSVTLVVSPNTTFEDRSSTIMIANNEFVVTQNAAKLEIEGGLVQRCDATGVDSLVVTVRVDVATASWTVDTSNDAFGDWIHLMSGKSAVTGDGTFELYVIPAKEGDTLPRTATVTVGNATMCVVQGEGVVILNDNTSFAIPTSWFAQYPTLGGSTIAEWQTIAENNGVKSAPVWHDYVAGTDPTNAASKFTAKIEMKDGVPSITWDPALNGEGVRKGNSRTYRVWGKSNLGDTSWSEVSSGSESGYNFFRVTVEMP